MKLTFIPYCGIKVVSSGDFGFGDGLFSLLGETENGSKKRFQRVEILKIAEPCPLIDPSQVVVTQGEILVADPVLTPLGIFKISFRRGHS